MGSQESFKRYVEVGRVVLLNNGENKNKIAVIVEIIDQNRAMIDGPSTGVARQPLRYREMTLTPLKIQLPLAAGTTAVKKAFDASGVAEKWANTKWAKTLQARETRKNTTDFERFHVQVLKKQRRRILGAAVKKVQA
ncbi:uncharacterized protein MJAP1_000804 [Malassezia japonica]|uniref:Large ribosomal subunit protein eL14 domain-containing protein n=1 Tax=Malassezia japonica TaxID=223818 RepID=A0AAF0J8P4_9BASI|nr:uncharacterized protein MJAP1_000804 [Malassezia japonica]WFD37857.1 hypothetical protein MJAP1_000804 [Malassezia japonica]